MYYFHGCTCAPGITTVKQNFTTFWCFQTIRKTKQTNKKSQLHNGLDTTIRFPSEVKEVN